MTPAGAHQSSRSSWANTASGCFTILTSTGTRGIGVGVGPGVAGGWPLAGGGRVGEGPGDGVTGLGVTVTVATVGRSGGGPATNRSTFETNRW